MLCLESAQDLRFSYDDEDALVSLAAQFGVLALCLQRDDEDAAVAAPSASRMPAGEAIEVRHYRVNDSVFFDGDYLIKGVPGAILWKLLKSCIEQDRCEFSNRELRMCPELRLPEISDNLEARLILLQRRLVERCPQLAIEKTGRGLFRLRIDCALRLVEAS